MASRRRYGKVTAEVISRLVGIVGAENVLTGEERQNYSRDEMPKPQPVLPEVVVRPGNTAAVAAVMSLANQRRIPVTPRGGGTGISGGAVPVFGGIVLSLERMNKILEIDDGNSVAVVEPGVTLDDFYPAVAEHGLYYPLYPGETSATIGGNVATNAGGMRAVKYGVTRHFVLGLEAVLPTGEIIETGGRFVKNSTGYDLTQLIIGSEGTLAVVTRITLRLINPPGRREILFVPFNSLHDAINTVPAILREKELPVGIEFMERDIIGMVEQYTGKEIPMHDYAAYLMIIIEADSEDEIHAIAERLSRICLEHGAVDVFLPGSDRANRNLLEFREKFYSVIGHYGMLDIADVVVPRNQIARFVEQAKQVAAGYGIPLVAYGHAGDGNVHLHPMNPEAGVDAATAKELMEKIYGVGVSLGGTISGEHGLGFAKKQYLGIATGKAKIELMRRIKRAFDPNGIMNPGKVL